MLIMLAAIVTHGEQMATALTVISPHIFVTKSLCVLQSDGKR